MDIKTLLNSPLASVRAFGVIVPAVMQEDPEGAKAALEAATHLASGLQRWSHYPFEPRDAALLRVSSLLNARIATSALTTWDLWLLTDLCEKAMPLPLFGTHTETNPNCIAFDEACRFVESAWRDEREAR
jgi:hypothetical protein